MHFYRLEVLNVFFPQRNSLLLSELIQTLHIAYEPYLAYPAYILHSGFLVPYYMGPLSIYFLLFSIGIFSSGAFVSAPYLFIFRRGMSCMLSGTDLSHSLRSCSRSILSEWFFSLPPPPLSSVHITPLILPPPTTPSHSPVPRALQPPIYPSFFSRFPSPLSSLFLSPLLQSRLVPSTLRSISIRYTVSLSLVVLLLALPQILFAKHFPS